jgi:tyrosine-protein kinase Etk/Wzc
VRARRELKLQETLLEAMVRQFEAAKLDEAKEGPLLQQIDKAVPPDYKSKPARALIVLIVTVLGLLGSMAWVIGRRYTALAREQRSDRAAAWSAMKQAWRLRR